MSPTYLEHHGILGQKWGVRRFQNSDGSLTTEGKERYSKSSKLANSLHKKASELEPKITSDVTSSIRESGSNVYGLDHRLKTQESTARKILTDSKEKRISLEETAKGINDSIRYTSLSNDNNFTSSYNKIKNSLQNKGYAEIKCKNYFDLYRQGKAKHKQITCVYQDKDGNKFEIQFQTPSSIKAKELKTPLYEEARNPNVSKERKAELVRQMEKLAETVKDPPGVYNIKSH